MATKPAKRKPAKKAVTKKSARVKAPAVESVSPASQPASAPSMEASPLKRKAITWGVAILAALWLWGPSCKHNASSPAGTPGAPAAPAAPAAAPAGASTELKASWGPKFSLKELSTIKAIAPIQDIAVDPSGTIYACTLTDLLMYKDGKLAKQANLGGAAYRNLAITGDGVYVTFSDNNGVALFTKQLVLKGTFEVKDGNKPARRSLAIAAYGKDKLAFCEVDGDKIYITDTKGHGLAQAGIIEKGESIGLIYDMQADGKSLYVNNVYGNGVKRWEGGKAMPFYKDPCSAQNMRKVALAGGSFYVGCAEDNVIVKIGMDGKYKGFAKFDRPVVLVAGQDGFLYAHDGNEITKLEPGKPEPGSPAPAAAEPAKAEPAKAEPAAAAPVKKHKHAKAKPAAAEPAKAEPVSAAPAESAPIAAEPAKAEASPATATAGSDAAK
jgi:hypothetical protein